MIVSLKGKFAEAVVEGRAIKGFPADLLAVAERRTQAIANAHVLGDLRSPPGNRLEALKGDRLGSIRFGSMTSGASASHGRIEAPRMSRSSTITEIVGART